MREFSDTRKNHHSILHRKEITIAEVLRDARSASKPKERLLAGRQRL
jgi:hypothetical protein